MKQAHVMISGTVQRVGYRYFVRSNAKKLGLNGWVRNTSNGKVEAVLQGSQEKIEEMLAFCKKGPMLSEVRDVEVEWDPSTNSGQEKFESFEIRKD